ncbi:MAG TPA: hypothetical protein VMT15_02410 [Bryobacteraceae bacterium]|nr:hypothetical protein [Bryobacteraceae bacterium]
MRTATLCLLAVAASLDGQSLTPPVRTLPVPVDASPPNMRSFWSRGYAIYSDLNTGSISVYETSGQRAKVVSQVQIWPNGTYSLDITSAAAAPRGTIFAASGSAYASTGEATGFLAFFGGGGPVKLVQLPYTGLFRVAFADDGTLWAIVREVSTFTALPEYNTLRHYDSTGKMLGSLLPASAFPGLPRAMLMPSLSASSETIGVYYDLARVWIELGYDGSTKGRWSVPDVVVPNGQRVRTLSISLSLTASGRVVRVSSTRGSQPSACSNVEYLTKSGPSLVSTPVNVSPAFSGPAFIRGFLGDQIVWQAKGMLNWSNFQ